MSDDHLSIVLVTVDSLRADALGCYGGDADTPNLERLAEESILFETAYATASDTTQSFPGILASNYPTTGGTCQNVGARVTVAEALRAVDYRTGAFHSNPLLSRAKGYARGFETFYDSLAAGEDWSEETPDGLTARLKGAAARRFPRLFGVARRLFRRARRRFVPVEQPHEPADQISQRALRWLQGAERPLLLWVHYMDPHWPYATRLPGMSEQEQRRAYRLSDTALKNPERLTSCDIERLRGYYRAELEHLDAGVGLLLDGLPDGCAVALTADHGQGFAEHERCFHGDLLYEEFIRVPLILRIPGERAARRSGVHSLIDLAPTLCELAGVEPPEVYEGESLLSGAGGQAAFAETAYRSFVSERPRRAAVRAGEWKLIRDLELGREELYHLADDPGETRSVRAERPEEMTRLSRALDAHLSRPRPEPGERPVAEPLQEKEKEELRRRLAALGYVDEARELDEQE
ncbi:MAG: sulfatase [Candidatus Brocadiia bacterium]